jgi:tetratricopeptide (TPR) repeat protein
MNSGGLKNCAESRRTSLVCLALAALTLAVYWPVRHHDFINLDDPGYVTENWHIQGGLTRTSLAWAFFNLHGEHSYWHPVTWVSHMLDCRLFGLNPGPHHLVNVAFHIANALLVLLVLRRMTGAFWRSALVAALFALHPLQVDTVAWVTERKNVLSTFFWLLTLWAYGRYAEKSKVQELKSETRGPATQNTQPATRNTPCSAVPGSRFEVQRSMFDVPPSSPSSILHPPSSIFYLLSLFLFAVGLMCKPALVTLPFVMLLLDYWPLQRYQPAPHNLKPPARKFHPSSFILHPLLLEKLPFLALAAAAAFITVAGHHELRATASLPWEWRVENALVSYARYLGKAFWPTHLAVFYPHPGAWPAWAVGGSALMLLAVSGWVMWRARRAPYLVTGWLWFLGVLVPMIGLIQAGGQAMADRFAYVPLIGLFIMIVWGAHDMATMIQHGHRATRINTDSDFGFRISDFPRRRAVPIGGAVLVLAGCVALTSRQLSYWQNSITLFQHALQVTRNNACAHFSLGYGLADEGKTQEAMQEWELALKIDPGLAEIHGKIASALCRQGDYAGAIARYRRALEVDPDQAEVLNNLAWLLAACPDPSLRNGPEAVQLAQRACEVTRFHRTIMVGTFAAAYAEAGRFTEAVATAQKACALAAAEGDRVLLARNQQLLELYRAGKPYHEPAGKAAR